MINVLFSAGAGQWDAYRAPLTEALEDAGLPARIAPDMAPEDVDYIVYSPASGVTDFAAFPRLRAVLSLWAGVERIVGNPTLTVPLTRMVDDGLREGMVEWVTGHVLRHHLGLDRHVATQDGTWLEGSVPPLARHRTVAILGLGALGQACATALAGLNFRVLGWSRTGATLPGAETHAGPEGLAHVLSRAEILILLLPETPATTNLMNAERLALLPPGAVIINPGRGPLIDDDALLAALERGHLAHVTLDVFRQEPLPPGHPFWAHPSVTVTPHIASATREDTASRIIADNISRDQKGAQMRFLVDRSLGY
ncbi:MAG: glyoxylate/hydroxypyruvate reductase A [Pseudomonadota bacterium]